MQATYRRHLNSVTDKPRTHQPRNLLRRKPERNPERKREGLDVNVGIDLYGFSREHAHRTRNVNGMTLELERHSVDVLKNRSASNFFRFRRTSASDSQSYSLFTFVKYQSSLLILFKILCAS